jgi:PAS domain S-box-containing protein
LAAILSAAVVLLVEREHAADEWVRRSRQVQNQIAQILVVAQRLESNQRGYLLTGRDRYLGNYNDAEKELPALFDETARLVADNRRQQETLAELRQVVMEKMGELRSTIDEQQAGRPDAARAIVGSDRGLNIMDQIRQIFSEMKNEEDRVLSNRLSALARIRTLSQVGAPIPLLLICVVGVLTRLYMRRSLAALEQSQMRIRLAMDAAHLGSWQYDPRRRVASGDERFKEIFDVAADEIHIGEIRKLVHPDDAERFWGDFSEMLDPAGPHRSANEYRVKRRDGDVLWAKVHWLGYFEGAGRERRVAGIVGTVHDITERKHHERLLQRQADLLNQSHDAILTWKIQSPGRDIVYWSRGAEVLYGYTAAEATGRMSHELLQTRAVIPMEEIEAQIVQHGSWYGELTHTTRDRRDIVVESHMVRVSYDGETFALETNRDITERKRAEEQVRLLMREMNHRAKNMFSVVDAIAHQTATRNPEDFIERFSERIQSLSANQELLVQNEWNGVDIGALVRAQLAHFADLIGSRIIAQGPMLRLKAVGAQAIGMALHELATNAGKYGALSSETGRVDIRWGTDGDTFTMDWVEREGPPVSAPTQRGFGTIVMEAMMERSLDGTVALDYAPSGVTWRLTCPAESSLEPTA